MSTPTATATYRSRPTRRARRSPEEMKAIREGLSTILQEGQPMTVRQVFYQATTRGLIAKTEAEYKHTVVRLLSEMRRAKVIPYGWIADSTRWMRKPTTYDSMEDALLKTAAAYRRSLWSRMRVGAEVWLEKEALAGVLYQETEIYDVPLMVTRGYPSLTYLQNAAESFENDGRPIYLYYFGDWDPSGIDISRVVERDLREMAPGVEIQFERVAVTMDQIEAWNLPTRPTKKSDTRARRFKGESVEVDAIPPDLLRELVRHHIQAHMPAGELERLKNIEGLERETLLAYAKSFRGD